MQLTSGKVWRWPDEAQSQGLEVLHDCGEMELVTRSRQVSEPQPLEAVVGFQVREAHLNSALLTDEDQYSTWLTGTPEEAFGVIRTSDPATMQIVQLGFDKKDLLAAA